MNIKGMIQKAKEKLFGKKSDEEKEAEPQKPYQKEFAEVIAEGTIAAEAVTDCIEEGMLDEAGAFTDAYVEPTEEYVIYGKGFLIDVQYETQQAIEEATKEMSIPDETKETVKQMLQEQEDEERMKQIMSEFEAMAPEQQAAVREKLQEVNLTVEELAERFMILGKEVDKLVEQIIRGLKPCMDALKMAWANIVYIDEPWEIERLKMSNNERRRRGIPMIRRRQYIRIRQNRKKKKKG